VSKRLAVFLPSLAGGGAERVTLNFARAASLRELRVDLVLSTMTGPYLSDVPDTINLVDLGASRVLTSLPALRQYLRRARPDAMVTAITHANLAAIWARTLSGVSTRVIVSEHDTLSVFLRETKTWRGQISPRLIRRFYPHADGIIAVSSGVADDLAAVTGLPRTSIDVVYNPVITPEVVSAARAEPDHPWLEPGQPPVVMGIGRLTQKKDFVTLLEAFAAVRRSTPARLMILGEGPERANLEEVVAAAGLEDDVALPGFVDNPYAYLSRASLFVLSSLWEGLPTVLIEALYCGTPVVSTDCPSGPDEILRGGRYGKLVAVGDVPALAEAISAGLAGDISPPPPESWHAYKLDVATDRYLELAFGGGSGP